MFMVGLSLGVRVNQKKKKKRLVLLQQLVSGDLEEESSPNPQGDNVSKWAKNYVPRLSQTELYV